MLALLGRAVFSRMSIQGKERMHVALLHEYNRVREARCRSMWVRLPTGLQFRDIISCLVRATMQWDRLPYDVGV